MISCLRLVHPLMNEQSQNKLEEMNMKLLVFSLLISDSMCVYHFLLDVYFGYMIPGYINCEYPVVENHFLGSIFVLFSTYHLLKYFIEQY